MLSKNKLNKFDEYDKTIPMIEYKYRDKTIPMIEYNDGDKIIPMIEYTDKDKTILMIEYNDDDNDVDDDDVDDDVDDDHDKIIPRTNKDIQLFSHRKSKRDKENGDWTTRQILWVLE